MCVFGGRIACVEVIFGINALLSRRRGCVRPVKVHALGGGGSGSVVHTDSDDQALMNVAEAEITLPGIGCRCLVPGSSWDDECGNRIWFLKLVLGSFDLRDGSCFFLGSETVVW